VGRERLTRVEVVLLVLLVVVVALVALVVVGHLRHRSQVRREVHTLLAGAVQPTDQVVTEEMLAVLPEPVQRYLSYTGVVGKPLVRTVWLRQAGRIRQDVSQPWMEYIAEQYYSIAPPAFVWDATARMYGVPAVKVRDRYAHGRGHMLMRVGGLLPVVDERGPEMDQGALMRFLNEMMWFPTAFLGENVTWRAIDDDSAEVTLTDGDTSVTATLHFDGEGRLTNFVGSRYRTVPGGYDLETWSTPITGYGEFEGLRLPVRGQGVWDLASGDLVYVEPEVREVVYDPAGMD